MDNESHLISPAKTAKFLSMANHPVKFRLFILRDLPAAFFSGVKVIQADPVSCQVSVPYKGFTKNPFRSTYFACLSMAAELSTGVLAMANLYGRKPSISMLITGMEARFHKKATGLTIFSCTGGEAIRDAVSTAIKDKSGTTVKAYSAGKNEAGEMVAEFWFSWSFRIK